MVVAKSSPVPRPLFPVPYTSAMRTGWIAAAIVAAVTVGTVGTFAAVNRERSLGPNPVVVELFTSQG